MKRNLLRKINGKVNYLNLAQIAALLAVILDVWRPFIPAAYLPFVVAGLATFTLIVSAFYGDTQGVSDG